MKRVYFDTETSGFKPGNIGQLSAIIEEDGNISTYNKYFKLDFITDDAAESTHRDLEFYEKASGGKTFKDYKDEILNIFSNATIIAHNVKFDMNFLSTELWRQDIIFKPLDTFDTMGYFKDKCKLPMARGNGFKNPKLSDVVNLFNIDEVKINKYAKQLFNITDELSYHDAMYDTTAMFVCVKIESDNLNGTDYFKKVFTRV